MATTGGTDESRAISAGSDDADSHGEGRRGRDDIGPDAAKADEEEVRPAEGLAVTPTVPRLWPGETVVILATGPSLTPAQVERAGRSVARVIAIKEAVRLLPDADVLYACDARWWKHFGPGLADYAGPRYALEPTPYATCLRNTGMTGLELDPTGLKTGQNSGYQSIGLARHLGASRILLLGFDMKAGKSGDHWFGAHTYPGTVPPRFQDFIEYFASIVAPLRAAGIEVINCTPDSALKCFPQMTLDEALERVGVQA